MSAGSDVVRTVLLRLDVGSRPLRRMRFDAVRVGREMRERRVPRRHVHRRTHRLPERHANRVRDEDRSFLQCVRRDLCAESGLHADRLQALQARNPVHDVSVHDGLCARARGLGLDVLHVADGVDLRRGRRLPVMFRQLHFTVTEQHACATPVEKHVSFGMQ